MPSSILNVSGFRILYPQQKSGYWLLESQLLYLVNFFQVNIFPWRFFSNKFIFSNKNLLHYLILARTVFPVSFIPYDRYSLSILSIKMLTSAFSILLWPWSVLNGKESNWDDFCCILWFYHMQENLQCDLKIWRVSFL